jgi:hypothetical protein
MKYLTLTSLILAIGLSLTACSPKIREIESVSCEGKVVGNVANVYIDRDFVSVYLKDGTKITYTKGASCSIVSK